MSLYITYVTMTLHYMRIRASGVHVIKSEFRIWINNYICTDIWDVVTQACCKKQFSKIDLDVKAWMKDYFTENTLLHLFIIMKADLLFLCEGLVPLHNAVDVYEDAHNIHPIIYLAIEFKILMGIIQEKRTFIAHALDLCLSCTNQLIQHKLYLDNGCILYDVDL